jgi:hypothetical protein
MSEAMQFAAWRCANCDRSHRAEGGISLGDVRAWAVAHADNTGHGVVFDWGLTEVIRPGINRPVSRAELERRIRFGLASHGLAMDDATEADIAEAVRRLGEARP